MHRGRLVAIGLVLTAAALLSCSSAAAVTTLWPTYHLDPGRSGNDSGEPAMSNASITWASPALDGAVYAEPLVDGNDVIVATENDSVYAFNATSGSVVWGPVSLGTPRTSNFPCGDINPLGITGTPVIDGGSLYVVAEIQTSSTTYAWHLAKLDPSTGAVAYSVDVTPSGMDPNVQQERSALAVSNGSVVIVWGGLDGDCGTYHGYIETASESTGAPLHQWNDTVGGREGGMWAPSGAAVDASGDIFVSTGNGSSTTITGYDYGDSVLDFSPTLTLQSFFAPGSPQVWTQLNGGDTDLGSTGPSLLSSGGTPLVFAIGKGGRGYLLNQSGLPGNSNPGGGENFSAQVCHATSNAAFGGLAISGSVVYVPCADGIAAVNVDSSTAFHTLWYQTSGGGGPAIVAGSLVWTMAMFGGSTLYGLQPSTGQIAVTLTLPTATQHFATPSAGDGHLLVGDGNRLVAASGDAIGQHNAAVAYAGQLHDFFFDSTARSLQHAWYSGGWQVETLDGNGSPGGDGRTTDGVGTDNSAMTYGAQLHDVYADAGGGLRHAWWDGVQWRFETLDGIGSSGGAGRVTSDHVGVANSALVYNGQLQVFYADTTAGTLRHAWWNGAQWTFETLDGSGTSGGGRASADSVGTGNSAVVYGMQVQDFYADATAGTLRHAWWDGAQWDFETLDGSVPTGAGRVPDSVGRDSSAVVYGGQVQDFYADTTTGTLRHAWWNGAHWTFETLDGNGTSGAGRETSHTVGVFSSALVYGTQVQEFYADTTAATLRHAWWNGVQWSFETLDGSGAGTGSGQVSDAVGTDSSAVVYGAAPHDFYYDSTHGELRHGAWSGAAWGFESLP